MLVSESLDAPNSGCLQWYMHLYGTSFSIYFEKKSVAKSLLEFKVIILET